MSKLTKALEKLGMPGMKNIMELVGETYPELKLSQQGAADLRIPLPK